MGRMDPLLAAAEAHGSGYATLVVQIQAVI
jgi:hypothetical protein